MTELLRTGCRFLNLQPNNDMNDNTAFVCVILGILLFLAYMFSIHP